MFSVLCELPDADLCSAGRPSENAKCGESDPTAIERQKGDTHTLHVISYPALANTSFFHGLHLTTLAGNACPASRATSLPPPPPRTSNTRTSLSVPLTATTPSAYLLKSNERASLPGGTAAMDICDRWGAGERRSCNLKWPDPEHEPTRCGEWGEKLTE